MKKFEYKTVVVKTDIKRSEELSAEITRHGENGWELVSMCPAQQWGPMATLWVSEVYCVYKREIN